MSALVFSMAFWRSTSEKQRGFSLFPRYTSRDILRPAGHLVGAPQVHVPSSTGGLWYCPPRAMSPPLVGAPSSMVVPGFRLRGAAVPAGAGAVLPPLPGGAVVQASTLQPPQEGFHVAKAARTGRAGRTFLPMLCREAFCLDPGVAVA